MQREHWVNSGFQGCACEGGRGFKDKPGSFGKMGMVKGGARLRGDRVAEG